MRPDDPHLEELVEVLAEDGEELGPLEQRQRSGPRPSASTRALKSSHESSRLRKRSDAVAERRVPVHGRRMRDALSSPATGQCYSRDSGVPDRAVGLSGEGAGYRPGGT